MPNDEYPRILLECDAREGLPGAILKYSLPVYAAENNTAAVYDLTQGGTQTFTLKDSDGKNVLITITELPSVTRALENRSYAVSYRSLLS